ADLLEVGDLNAADLDRNVLERAREPGSKVGQPFYLYLAELHAIAQLIYQGHFAEAEARAQTDFELSQQIGHPEALGILLLQLGEIGTLLAPDVDEGDIPAQFADQA